MSDCYGALAQQNEDGSRLREIVGGDAAGEIRDRVAESNRLITSVGEKVKAEAERVKLQRHRSLEVSSLIFFARQL